MAVFGLEQGLEPNLKIFLNYIQWRELPEPTKLINTHNNINVFTE